MKDFSEPILLLMDIIPKPKRILPNSVILIIQYHLQHQHSRTIMVILKNMNMNAEYILLNAKMDTAVKKEQNQTLNHAENGGFHAILEHRERRSGRKTQTAEG